MVLVFFQNGQTIIIVEIILYFAVNQFKYFLKFQAPDEVEDFEEDDVNSVMFDSNGYYSENGDIARRKEAKNTTNKVRRQVRV